MARDISICIATCHRPAGLARLLGSLAKLQIPEDVSIEILVVDNDAEGSGAAVAHEWADGPHPLRVLIEPRQNVAHARNRAVEVACGSWLAFIDDDEIADERWLAAYWSRIQADDCDGWFGPVLPRLEETVTAWMDPEGFYGRRRHPSGTRIGAGETATSNAFLRRGLFAAMRFDPAFGDPPAFGEDRELFGRMLEAGARFGWCDEAVVTEFVPAARHRLGWLARRALHGAFVTTQLARRAQGRGARARGLARALLGLVLFGLLLPVAALGGRRRGARIWLRLCVQAGHLWAALVPKLSFGRASIHPSLEDA
jgi:glycosyltransferase involved in cell wall biosynthesis